ncbi:hypothetical protein ACO2Q1_03550 [Brevundimonas sp. VNH65]|uniref:hypothetical protein n=1 Tax=Brevundimonas sp. VNH65 TaxID=3400917 RepID=UPI003BFF9DAD
MARWEMFLQAYVRADGYDRAFDVARDLIAVVAREARVTQCRVNPYYKFEDQYGVMLLLEADDMPAAWTRLQTNLAEPWHVGGDETDRHAIWDVRMGSPCVVSDARWLNLELFGGARPDDEEA